MRYKSKKNIKKALIEKYAFKLKEILRINSDVTQEELAATLKTSAANVSKWVNEKHLPKPNFRLIIDKYYEQAIRYESENMGEEYAEKTNQE